MAWTAPRTWVAGELVTAGIMNTHVRDNFNGLSTQAWTWSADQTWTDNTKITLGTGGDVDLFYDGSDTVIKTRVVGTGAFVVQRQDTTNAFHSNSGMVLEGTGAQYLTLLSDGASEQGLAWADAGSTIAAQVTYAHGAGRLDIVAENLISCYSDVAIGATKKLYLDGGNDTYIFQQAANVLQCVSGGSGGVKLTSGATSWASVSDERLKTIIEPIEMASVKLGTLRSVIGRFHSDPDDRRRSMLIAQDVQAVLPEAVVIGADGFLSLKYSKVTPLLVAGHNEHSEELAWLNRRISELEARMAQLTA